MTMGRWIWLLATLALLLAAGLVAFPDWRQPPVPKEAPMSPAIGEEAAERDPVPDLRNLLQLSSDCDMQEPLASIFRQMTVIDQDTFESRPGGPISIPGLGFAVTPTFHRTVTGTDHGEERQVVAELPLAGSWRGLRVVGLRLDYFEESDVFAREIHFDEPPDRVRYLLNQSGFALPETGQVRPVGPAEGIETVIGVDRTPEGSALRCATG